MEPAAERRMQEIFARVLERIKPPKHEVEHENAIAKRIIARLREFLPKEIEVMLTGSVAKETNLRDDRDIDIFLLFPKGYAREDLLTKGIEYAKRAVKPGERWEIGYAEHPYVRAKIENCNVEFVPCFKIGEINEKVSSVDRTPLHTRYVLEFLTDKGKDEVRLLKAFMKRLGVYGAEVRVEGFSGYLCELLIIEFENFRTLLEQAARWERPVIDTEVHHPNIEAIRKKFPDAPMVVIDPVDPDRNVAAAVSQTALSRFVLAAREFLKNPTERFFFAPKVRLKEKVARELHQKLRDRGTHVIAMRFAAPKVVEDILWPQLRKTAKIFAWRLEERGFRLFDHGYWSDGKSCLLLFEFEVERLPAVRKVLGPEVKHIKGVENFVREHRNALSGPWVEGSRVVVVEPREYSRAEHLVDELARHPERYAIPSHIAKTITKYTRLNAATLFAKKYRGFMHEYLVRREFFYE